MKRLEMKTLTQQTIKELVKMRNSLKKELFEMRSKNVLRSLKQTHLIRIVRKNIARVNTVLSAKIKENNGNSK